MAGPWEAYASQPPQAGPWQQYQTDQPSTFDTAVDVAKGLGTGLAHGVGQIPAIPENVEGLMQWGARSAIGAAAPALASVLPEGWTGTREALNAIPGALDTMMKLGAPSTERSISATGKRLTEKIVPDYLPKTTEGKYAKTIGEFIPATALMPGNLIGNAVRFGAIPGAASEAGGQATQGTEFEPWARVAGALAGGIAPALAGRSVTPLPVNSQRAAAVQTLKGEGVDSLSAGQVTGRKPLQYFESEMGGRSAQNLTERGQEQFTQAAMKRGGSSANRATPDAIDQNFSRIGQQIEDVASRNQMVVDTTLWDKLQKVQQQYHTLTPDAMRSPFIEKVVNDIGQAGISNQGAVPGLVYQSLRSELGALERSSSGPMADAVKGVRRALDDAMERSISGKDLDQLKTARKQYRNMLVLEKAATGAGADTAAGLISPAQLRNAARTQDPRGFARGKSDFTDLTNAGVQIMTPMPNSGTASRLSAQNFGLGIGAGIGVGGAVGAALGGPFGAAAGGLLGAMAPRVAARAVLSNPLRGYLSNQMISGPQSVPAGLPLAAYLAAQGQQPRY